MPEIAAELTFLTDLPLYRETKPYVYLPARYEDIDPDDETLSNLHFTAHSDVTVRDMRDWPDLIFKECGFEFINHHASRIQKFSEESDVDLYKSETSTMLKYHFSAEVVFTYDLRLRKNETFHRVEIDLNDKLLVEGPARGAHNDVTLISGPNIVRRHLDGDAQRKYLRPGYRIRIVNTWRPLNKVLEDRPLALCDSRTVAAQDLIPADRILPDRTGEVYYLRYNPRQQWYWLEKQKSTEPFIFLMYDTMASENSARLCPHVSFDNSRASPGAECRSSVETRSIVVTRAA